MKRHGPSLVLLIFMCAGLSLLARSASAADERPNIIILYADDLGYGDLGCYNPDSRIPTPNLDKLAEGGVVFLDGHSSSGICTPSRYALLTGRHHWRSFHGIVNAFDGSVFKDEQLTLPEMLKAKGYHTACIGKWHLGWDWDAIRIGDKEKAAKKKGESHTAFDWTKPIPDGPLAHGFDHYFGDDVINFPPYTWIEDDKVVQAPDTQLNIQSWPKIKEGNWESRPGPMVTSWNPYDVLPTLEQRAVAYVESRKAKAEPFLLFFSYPSPHAPIIPNDEFDGKSKAGPYGDFVYQSDQVAGSILNALDQAGMADNTVVVFTADNGPEHYAYTRSKKYGHWSSAPLRGLKRDVLEGGHRVPFIVRWPGVIKPGTTSDALVSQIDIFATLASALGYPLPDDAAHDSHDMLPYLKGEQDAVRESHVHNTFKGTFALRHGDWLYINNKTGNHTKPNLNNWEQANGYLQDNPYGVMLFNLKDDIAQRNNLAGEHPDKVKQMDAMLTRIQRDGRTRAASE